MMVAESIKRYQAHKQFGDRRMKLNAARTYFYQNEAQCEKNMETFLRCIEAVAGKNPSKKVISDTDDTQTFRFYKLNRTGSHQSDCSWKTESFGKSFLAHRPAMLAMGFRNHFSSPPPLLHITFYGMMS